MKTTIMAAMMVVAGCTGGVGLPGQGGTMALAMTSPFSILATTADPPSDSEPAVTATAAQFLDNVLDIDFIQQGIFSFRVSSSYAKDSVAFGPQVTAVYHDLRSDGGGISCSNWTGYGVTWIKAPPGAWQLYFSGTCTDYTAVDGNFPVEISISGTADELYLTSTN